MLLRKLESADLEACVELTADVGWQTPRDNWSFLLRFGSGYGLFDAGELAGTVITFPHERYIFLGMMLVRPHLRRRGYARRLLEHAVKEADGVPAALLATEMGLPLYKTVGFIERGAVITHEGYWRGSQSTEVRVVEPSMLSHAERSRLVSADSVAAGCRRTVLIEALLSTSSRVAVIEKGADLSFAIASQHGSVAQIGPIVASDDDSAFALLNALGSESGVRVRVPEGRISFRERIAQYGLPRTGAVTLMTRGEVPLPRPSWYAIARPSTG